MSPSAKDKEAIRNGGWTEWSPEKGAAHQPVLCLLIVDGILYLHNSTQKARDAAP